MTNPLADPYFVLLPVYRDGKYLKQSLADTPIEPLNRARTVRISYGVLEKNIYLDEIIAQNCQKSPKSAVKLILKIALYMLEFTSVRDYAVVDCAVELAKKLGKGGAAGFINAFLRSYKLPAIPAGADARISLECSAPLWLVKRLRRSYKGEAQKILAEKSRGVCVQFERNAQKYLDIPHEDTPFKNTYIFKNFVRDEGFFAGDYTFRSIGSAAICEAIEGGESLLDACAAPGGKSVLLSKKFARVTACELHPHRVELIKAYAERMGVENVTYEARDSSVFCPDYFEKFDAVLVDAPCSGTGVINENPDIMLFRKESDIQNLIKIQKAILDNCAKYVKRGGKLYYSTCSVLPEENDSAAYNFLSGHGEFSFVPLSSPLGHKKTGFGMQFLPHISLGAGFYLTCFERK